jgi:hypothetical protein
LCICLKKTFAGTSTKGEFFITHDGGLSFTVKSLLSGALPTFTFSKIGFANEGVSIAIYYAETAKYLLKTTDGWQTQSNILAPPEYFGGDMFYLHRLINCCQFPLLYLSIIRSWKFMDTGILLKTGKFSRSWEREDILFFLIGFSVHIF